MGKIKIGKVVAPHGIKGYVKIYNYSDPGRFDSLQVIEVDDKQYKIESVSSNKNLVLVKLDGINDRNAAERLKGKSVSMDEANLKELGEDEYFIKDLIGLNVYDIMGDKLIGVIKDVIQNGPTDTYQVEKPNGKQAFIPAVRNFVKGVELGKGVFIETIPGLIDED